MIVSTGDGRTEARGWGGPGLLLSLIGVALAHGAGVGGDFVYDDVTDLVEHPVVNGAAPLSDLLAYNYMGSPLGEGANTIRPLATLLFALLWRAVGPNPVAFHALAFLLYAGCVAMACRTFRLFLAPRAAAVAALVFGVMAIHVEVSASIANSAEALSLLLAFAAFEAAVRDRPLFAVPFYVAALLAKESAFLLPLLVAWYWICQEGVRALHPRRRGRMVLWLASAAVAYLVARSALQPMDVHGRIIAADNPLLLAGLVERAWMPLVLLGHYLEIAVAPTALSADYSYAVIPVTAPPGALVHALVGVGWCAVALVAMFTLRRREEARGVLFALGAFFITYALFANAAFLHVTLLAERLFLAPSAWLVLALAGAASRLPRRGQRLALALAAVVCATQIPLAASRCLDWRTTDRLLAAQVETRPDSVKGQLYRARGLARADRWDEALWHLAVAADGRRAFPGPWRAPRPGVDPVADLPPEERALCLPAVFADGGDPLAYFGGLRGAATATLGPASGAAIDDLVRRYRDATARERGGPPVNLRACARSR